MITINPAELLQGKIVRTMESPINNISLFNEKVSIFEESLKSEKVETAERTKTLEQWIDSISDIKTQLEQDITKDNLELYKGSIKKFLDYYVHNDLYLEEHTTKDGPLYTKKIQILKAVDEKIDSLTDQLVDSQMGRLEILKQTGSIQGLLFELTI